MSAFKHATLTVNFLNYWHTGSGAGAGHSVDARCLRDQNDLQFIAGRQIKGGYYGDRDTRLRRRVCVGVCDQ